MPTFPGYPGPDTGQVAGEHVAAGGTVPGDQGGLEGHQHHTGRVRADTANTMREAVTPHRASATSRTNEQPSTSAAASGQEAPPQVQQATSTPPPAEGEPPRKRSLRSR
ncbi:hypothetical protein NDU88_002378 [Pleurodeles waltl]|uniref:Uncharacterized protein n=1 Tax=Pleurodeles waltl TaxID=8319 RepID=A0AAV7VD25_PLEWA|nr:hypothetical protein NDU88_002378 [Pleurodeles waltl]